MDLVGVVSIACLLTCMLHFEGILYLDLFWYLSVLNQEEEAFNIMPLACAE